MSNQTIFAIVVIAVGGTMLWFDWPARSCPGPTRGQRQVLTTDQLRTLQVDRILCLDALK